MRVYVGLIRVYVCIHDTCVRVYIGLIRVRVYVGLIRVYVCMQA